MSDAIQSVIEGYREVPPWVQMSVAQPYTSHVGIPRIDAHRFSGVSVKRNPSISTLSVPAPAEDLTARLFRNRAELKLLTSQIAMHLASGERNKIFRALDRLLAIEHWDGDSSLVDAKAFRSFLRFMIYSRPKKFANLGVGATGTVLAAWRRSRERVVHVEFFPDDECLAIITARFDRGLETLVREGNVARLREALQGIGVVDCLDEAEIDPIEGYTRERLGEEKELRSD